MQITGGYGKSSICATTRSRSQTARSGSFQSRRGFGSEASWDDGEIRPRIVADVADRRYLLLRPARSGRDRTVVAVSERRRNLFLDQARVRRRARVFVRLVLLDQQRALLPEPVDLRGGDRDLRLRQRREWAERQVGLCFAGDARRAVDRD